MKRFTAVLIAALLTITLSACRDDYTKEGGQITTANIEELKLSTETTIVEDELFAEEATTSEATETTAETMATVGFVLDREGTLVGIPTEINRIASGSERVTRLLVELGLGGKIVVADKESEGITGVTPSVCTLNKKIITASSLEPYEPDLVILSGTSADSVYVTLKNAGVNVICIPDPSSISGIKLDIQFLAEYLSVKDKGQQLIDEIDGVVVDISSKAATIAAKRKVYFECQSNPEMKAYGDKTLAGEIMDIVCGVNMYSGQEGTITVASQDVITANPNVILTTVSYDGYDLNEIMARTGWGEIKAVKTASIRQIGEISSTASVTDSIYEVAKAIYPEIFKD